MYACVVERGVSKVQYAIRVGFDKCTVHRYTLVAIPRKKLLDFRCYARGTRHNAVTAALKLVEAANERGVLHVFARKSCPKNGEGDRAKKRKSYKLFICPGGKSDCVICIFVKLFSVET